MNKYFQELEQAHNLLSSEDDSSKSRRCRGGIVVLFMEAAVTGRHIALSSSL